MVSNQSYNKRLHITMKKYFTIVAVLIVSAVAFSFAHAESTTPVTPSEVRTVGTLNGAEIEIDAYTNAKGVVSYASKVVTKATYASEIAGLNAQITELQAEIVTDQGLSAQLAN
jgi:hypothetical protein